MGTVRTTRTDRRLLINKYELYKPFAFYAVLLAALNAAALDGNPLDPASAVALLCGGLLTWGLIEYAIHRWVLHRAPRIDDARLHGNRVHLAHHLNPAALDRPTCTTSTCGPMPACPSTWPAGTPP